VNSRAKGKRGEREAAAFLTANGYPARRGCQFSGSPDSPDVECPFFVGVHFEVKRTQRTDLEGWLAQAAKDAGTKLPLVLHRKNRGPWIAILRAEDAFALLRDTNSGRVARIENHHRQTGPSGEAPQQTQAEE
jgi:hypothetical protein